MKFVALEYINWLQYFSFIVNDKSQNIMQFWKKNIDFLIYYHEFYI